MAWQGGRSVKGVSASAPWPALNRGQSATAVFSSSLRPARCVRATRSTIDSIHTISFMELSADYDRPLHGSLRWQIYGGFAGEPALGPAGFPHRISAMANPIAPIAHHWLDSTHITYGLITTGIYDRRWKAEMSVFNGREPDENRADVDLGALDSFSARLAISPTSRLSLQISAAHLHESEAEFPPNPRSDLNRATASATYHRPLGGDGIWATTLGWGLNSGREIILEGSFDATLRPSWSRATSHFTTERGSAARRSSRNPRTSACA